MASYLEDNPADLTVCLEAYARYSREDIDGDMATAYLLLMTFLFEYLRYRQEGDSYWAQELTSAFQTRMLAMIREGGLSLHGATVVMSRFRQARLTPLPELASVLDQADDQSGEAGAQTDGLDPAASLEQMLAEIDRRYGRDVFAISESLGQAGNGVPPDMFLHLIGEIVHCDYPNIRDAAVLTLFDNRRPVRRAVARMLQAAAGQLGPAALRRLIVVRSWLPAEERLAADRIIRAARTARVECDPWPAAVPTEIYASAIDGAGAQAFLIVSRDQRRYRLSSVLCRREAGILDAWTAGDMPRRELDRVFGKAVDQGPVQRVSLGFFNRMVAAALASGEERNAIPPIGLLAVAEAIGVADWRPVVYDWRRRCQEVLTAVRPTPEAIEDIVVSSGLWSKDCPLLPTWYEDDAEVEELLKSTRVRKPERLVELVVGRILEPRRLKWAPRFAHVADWLHEVERAEEALWHSFAVVALEVERGRPLMEIPLMATIAVQTVMAHRRRSTPPSWNARADARV